MPEGLAKAAKDDRVRPPVANVGSLRMGFARAQQLRDAVPSFRAAGKPAGGPRGDIRRVGSRHRGLLLGTAFDEIWLQPTGDVTLNGLALRTTFLRKPFDKLEVEPQFGQRYKYKNPANVLLRSTFSDAHPVAADLLDQPGDPPASPPSVGEDLLHGDAARSAAMITRIRPH